MKKLTKLEWEILQNLSNNCECPATICPEVADEVKNSSRKDILKTLHDLFNENFIYIDGVESIQSDELLSEPEKNFDTKFWFGLTDKGCEAWEKHSVEFCGEPIIWKNAWRSYETSEGISYIVGVNKTVCIEGLKQVHPDSWEEKITDKLIEEQSIDGFNATYYKYIKGGYRIKYKLNKSDKKSIRRT